MTEDAVLDRTEARRAARGEGRPAEPALIELRGITRTFPAGAQHITVLDNVDLDIRAGEMVAIMGASGSGKSTLMNILGCLDRPTAGTYRFAGRDVGGLGADELAELRREHFGFIFQRYQLLADLDAVENVAIPAVYAGVEASRRNRRATELLQRLGLGDRLRHRPNQLSGGQQQRVSVARALMNGGEVILADEPTGALDSRSGAELLDLLGELHAEGHTIIVVTHDPAVARRAERIVEIKDGRIVSDRPVDGAGARRGRLERVRTRRANPVREWIDRGAEALSMAVRAMATHKLRTFLTMLGIIIGIASVVSVVALGQGSQQQVLENIAAIGTNTINVYPGSGFGDRSSQRVRTLMPSDADAIATQPYADSVTPRVSANASVLFKNVAVNAQVSGVGTDYFRVSGATVVEGTGFNAQSIATRAQEAILDQNAVDALFKNGEDPVGQVILLGKVPVRVIGVVKPASSFGPGSDNANVYVPYTTAMTRILGRSYLSQIIVRVADTADMDTTQSEIEALLTRLHGGKTDFFLQNTNTIRDTIQSTTQTLTLLVSSIALISLIVGGIGVMNIMLVSVSERTREIGIRMAVGARRSDILRQFLTEAVLVCLVGGAIGIALSYLLGFGLTAAVPGVRLAYSTASILTAIASSSVIGIAFGFMPARSAARLDPVQALARE